MNNRALCIFSIFILLSFNKVFGQAYISWVKQFSSAVPVELEIDAQGNVYSIGVFSGTVDFDPGIGTYNLTVMNTTNTAAQDMFILKQDSAGNFIWVKHIGGQFYDVAPNAFELNSFGDIIITGEYGGSVDFNPGVGVSNLNSNGIEDLFLLKLDPNGNFQWVKSCDGTGEAYSHDLCIDVFGNILVTGNFSGIIDFDSGPLPFNLTSNGFTDIFVLKCNQNGDFQWVKKMGGISYDVGRSLVCDGTGAIYTVGTFQNTVDFNPGTSSFSLNSLGSADAFIQKLDLNGNFIWAKAISGIGPQSAHEVILDNQSLYITGFFQGTADFDPSNGILNLISNGLDDCFVTKFDLNGLSIWAKSYGGNDSDQSESICMDQYGELYVSGDFKSTVDFDLGNGIFNLTSVNGRDMFLQKLDSSGNFIWAYQIGGTSSQINHSLKLKYNNEIICSGVFSGTTDFDPGPNQILLTNLDPSYDGFILNLGQCINFNNSVGITNNTNSTVLNCTQQSITVTASQGNIFNWNGGMTNNLASNTFTQPGTYTVTVTDINGCTGASSITITQDTTAPIPVIFGTSAFCSGDSVLLSVSNGSNFLWNNGSTLQSLVVYQPGNYTVNVGYSNGCTASQGLNVSMISNTISSFNFSACNSLIYNNQTYTQSGIYTQQLTNAQGCDSIITLNLTITQPSNSTIAQTACGSFTLNNQTYSQSGIFTQQLTNAQGCDSIITLNLTIIQPSNSTITQTACGSFTLNNQTYSQSGIFTQQLTNAQGCDSTLTLNLIITILPSNTMTLNNGILSATQQNATYQWLDCNLNFSPISGETNIFFTPLVTGNYAVVITQNNCGDTSGCTYVQVGSSYIIENFVQVDKIFPNPNNGAFIFDSALGGIYFVTDLEGRLIYKFQCDKSEKSFLDLNSLSKGVYFLIKENESKDSLKLIIE